MERYVEGDLSIEVTKESDAYRLAWRGKSSARDPGATLHPFFERVAGAAKDANIGVELRLNELEYFNSSTLAAIIRAIRKFRAQGTHVVVSYAQASGWQRRSCEALRVLEDDGVMKVRGD